MVAFGAFPGGLLLGIFGGGVPPGSPNPGPISDQRMSFFTPITGVGRNYVIMTKIRTPTIISTSYITLSFLFIWN